MCLLDRVWREKDEGREGGVTVRTFSTVVVCLFCVRKSSGSTPVRSIPFSFLHLLNMKIY